MSEDNMEIIAVSDQQSAVGLDVEIMVICFPTIKLMAES
jgi:hypothetical protein